MMDIIDIATCVYALACVMTQSIAMNYRLVVMRRREQTDLMVMRRRERTKLVNTSDRIVRAAILLMSETHSKREFSSVRDTREHDRIVRDSMARIDQAIRTHTSISSIRSVMDGEMGVFAFDEIQESAYSQSSQECLQAISKLVNMCAQ